MAIIPGLYKHFKGSIYRVVGIAKHSETLEEHVIYISETNDSGYWVRPLAMFDSYVERDGVRFKRFEFIE